MPESARRSSFPPEGASSGPDASDAGASLGLRLVAGADGRLPTKAQRRFDRLLRKVETLRSERERAVGRWERFVTVYRERIHPEETRMIDRRRQLAHLLLRHWRAPKGLGARQRDQLADLLLVQLRELRGAGPEAWDEELGKVWDELNPAEAEAETTEAREPESEPPTAPEASEAPQPDKSAARAELREEARKRTAAGIYKQLAKALHPDLEQDAARREMKHGLMQELTKAHREGDLHTLLRLELAWLDREEGDLARLGDAKLGLYSELLEEQVAALQAEIRDVSRSPRFAMVARFARHEDGQPRSADEILVDIRGLSRSLKDFKDALSGPAAREQLRLLLAQIADLRRRTAEDDFGAGF